MNQDFKLFLMLTFLLPNLIHSQMYWEKLHDNLSSKQTEKPAPRRDAAIGYDIERQRVIVFGGWQNNPYNYDTSSFTMPVLFDDTWEYSLKTKLWRPLSFSLQRPTPRYGMLYSHNKYGLYISCGRGLFENYFNDLWVYDFNDDQWRKMDQTYISITPEARYSPIGGIYPSYEFNSNEIKNNLYLGMGRAQYEMFDNMFYYQFTDLRSLNGMWDRVYTDILTGPYSFTHPHGRAYSSSTMISPDELLIHSGCLSGSFSGGPCPSSDSWIFNHKYNKWEKVDSSCISPRLYSSMASLISDGYRKSAVLFSGLETDRTILKTDKELEDEVALYDNLANRWVIKKVQGFYFPEKRDGHVMCTGKINTDYGVFMYGGYGHSSDSSLGDLWFLKVNVSTVFENFQTSNFYSPQNNNNKYKCSTFFSTIHMHAILMFVGWAILINISNIISKYFKSRKYSNIFYYTFVFLGILTVSIGLIFGFWSSRGLPHLAHLTLGITAYLLILIQPITTFMREKTKKIDYYIDEDEKTRALQYKSGFSYNTMRFFSKNLSITSITLASVNISLGVFYAVLEWYWVVVWFTYLGANFFLYIVLEISKYNKKAARRKSKEPNEDSDSEDEFSLSKASSTQQLKPAGNDEQIRMEPLRYTNPRKSITQRNLNDSVNSCLSNENRNKASNDRLSYSQKINVSYIGDGDFDTETNYVTAKRSALRVKIESLTSSPISSIGIHNQAMVHDNGPLHKQSKDDHYTNNQRNLKY